MTIAQTSAPYRADRIEAEGAGRPARQEVGMEALADAQFAEVELMAPFAPARFGSAEVAEIPSTGWAAWTGPTASPFAEAMVTGHEAEIEQVQRAVMSEMLADESFDEAVEALVDETAGRHLQSMASWSSHEEAPTLAARDAAEWLDEVGGTADRLLAQLEQEYADRTPESVTMAGLNEALERHASAADPIAAASEQLFGGLVKKAFKAAKGLAKAGLSVATRFLPMGRLFGLLRPLVGPLLKRVLAKAINRLPAQARGPATDLARRMGAGAAAAAEAGTDEQFSVEQSSALASEFDARFTELLLAPTQAAAEQLTLEVEAEAGAASLAELDPMSRLDAARTDLARQLAEAEPGRAPTEALEQFIPAVMAAMPLIRRGVQMVGRDRVKRFVAEALATLIQGYVGPAAARALAPPIADAGLRLLRLEAESPETRGAEALVDTLEETITAVAALPESALRDPLRLEAETAEAFAEAAARLLPRSVLRSDLETFETEAEDEGEAWVLMPRAGGRRRYRRLGRVFDVAISRPQARAVVLGEDTLEERLLEAGVERWPVAGEAYVYETMTGTRLGHLAAFEGEGQPVSADEFEELTPESAAILLGRPGLGRRPFPGLPGHRGRRLVRLVIPGRVLRRRPSRLVLRLDSAAAQPTLRVHLRIGERASHAISGHLGRQALPDALAVVRRVLTPAVQASLAGRLVRHLNRVTGQPVAAARGQALAAHLVEGMLSALSQHLPGQAAELATAAKDPRSGTTLTFGFRFPDKAALGSGTPEAPSLTIRPGWHRD